MKIVMPDLFPPFELYDNKVNVLVIENREEFFGFCESIYRMAEGGDGEIVLSKNDTPLKLSANIDILPAAVPFEMNGRKLLTKLYDRLKITAVNEAFYEKTMRLNAYVQQYIYELADDLDCETDIGDFIDLGALFKGMDLKFCDDHAGLSEKLVSYMLNVREIIGERVFAAINYLPYIGSSQRELLFETIASHRLTVLFIDSSDIEPSPIVNKLIIDEDYCII